MDGYSYDPFAGECGSDHSAWVEQGAYGGLPGPTCDSWASCEPAATITCGETYSGRNDDPGSTNFINFEGCYDGRHVGSEFPLAFVTDLDEPVTLSLQGLSEDLDLFVHESTACDPTSCLAVSHENDASNEQIVFQATAGHPYTVVVEGWEGSTSAYSLTVACNGKIPVEDQIDTGSVESPRDDSPASGIKPGEPTEIDSIGDCAGTSPLGLAMLVGFSLLFRASTRISTRAR
jgi:hypothetical protein